MNVIRLPALLFPLLLVACASPSFRDVPQYKWEKLTQEQKQIIVDKSYDTEFNS